MASMKEIARQAGVSIGTVSVVLNGRAEQLRISKKTCDKVMRVAKQLDYHPNISARKLRKANADNKPTIAVFWANNFPSELLGRFFIGIQNCMLERGFECDIIVQPFRPSELHKAKLLASDELCNGAILTGVSDEDLAYLEQNETKVPIVVFNRKLASLSAVYVEDYEAGRRTAELFASRGHRSVGLIAPDAVSQAMALRSSGFIDGCRAYGMSVLPGNEQYAVQSMHGGQWAAQNIMEGEAPSALFFPNGIMAVGALPVFHRAGIRIPEDIEIITYGDSEHERYTMPALTSIVLPVEEMSSACVEMIMEIIKGKANAPLLRAFETPFIFRESCKE